MKRGRIWIRQDRPGRRSGASPRLAPFLYYFFPLVFRLCLQGECGCGRRVSRWGRGAGGRLGSIGPARSDGAGGGEHADR